MSQQDEMHLNILKELLIERWTTLDESLRKAYLRDLYFHLRSLRKCEEFLDGHLSRSQIQRYVYPDSKRERKAKTEFPPIHIPKQLVKDCERAGIDVELVVRIHSVGIISYLKELLSTASGK